MLEGKESTTKWTGDDPAAVLGKASPLFGLRSREFAATSQAIRILRDGHRPLVGGVELCPGQWRKFESDFFSAKDTISLPPERCSKTQKKGHAVLVVGYRRDRRTGEMLLVYKNSWGRPNYGALAARYFQNFVDVRVCGSGKYKECIKTYGFLPTSIDDGILINFMLASAAIVMGLVNLSPRGGQVYWA